MDSFIQMGGIPFSNLKKNKISRKRKRTKRKIKRTKRKIKRTKKKKINRRYLRKKRNLCICDPKGEKIYKIISNSPEGLGYCSHCIPINVVMKGKDGNLWENKKFKGQNKKWIKLNI